MNAAPAPTITACTTRLERGSFSWVNHLEEGSLILRNLSKGEENKLAILQILARQESACSSRNLLCQSIAEDLNILSFAQTPEDKFARIPNIECLPEKTLAKLILLAASFSLAREQEQLAGILADTNNVGCIASANIIRQLYDFEDQGLGFADAKLNVERSLRTDYELATQILLNEKLLSTNVTAALCETIDQEFKKEGRPGLDISFNSDNFLYAHHLAYHHLSNPAAIGSALLYLGKLKHTDNPEGQKVTQVLFEILNEDSKSEKPQLSEGFRFAVAMHCFQDRPSQFTSLLEKVAKSNNFKMRQSVLIGAAGFVVAEVTANADYLLLLNLNKSLSAILSLVSEAPIQSPVALMVKEKISKCVLSLFEQPAIKADKDNLIDVQEVTRFVKQIGITRELFSQALLFDRNIDILPGLARREASTSLVSAFAYAILQEVGCQAQGIIHRTNFKPLMPRRRAGKENNSLLVEQKLDAIFDNTDQQEPARVLIEITDAISLFKKDSTRLSRLFANNEDWAKDILRPRLGVFTFYFQTKNTPRSAFPNADIETLRIAACIMLYAKNPSNDLLMKFNKMLESCSSPHLRYVALLALENTQQRLAKERQFLKDS